MGVQQDGFVIAVAGGFGIGHDGIHVVAVGFGFNHGYVGVVAGKRADAHADAFAHTLFAQKDDLDVVLFRSDAQLAGTVISHRTEIAGSQIIGFNDINMRPINLFLSKRQLHTDDFRRVKQAFGVVL